MAALKHNKNNFYHSKRLLRNFKMFLFQETFSSFYFKNQVLQLQWMFHLKTVLMQILQLDTYKCIIICVRFKKQN